MTGERKRAVRLIREAFRAVVLGDGVGLKEARGLGLKGDILLNRVPFRRPNTWARMPSPSPEKTRRSPFCETLNQES